MKIVHLSFSDLSGGASIAAYRVHSALLNAGIKSELWVMKKFSKDNSVIDLSSNSDFYLLIIKTYIYLVRKLLTKSNLISLNYFNSNILERINRSDADIINLHWVHNEMISLEQINKINKPIVWTLHDAWIFSGASHYEELHISFIHKLLNRWVSKRKVRYLTQKNITFICNSAWTLRKIIESGQFSDAEKTVIHYPFDTSVWRPNELDIKIPSLNIRPQEKVILFGAIDSTRDKRKGFHLLLESLCLLGNYYKRSDLKILIFGADRMQSKSIDMPFDMHFLGYITDPKMLSKLYTIADMMVVPSLFEALGQTAIEAQLCGTPVVAFSDTGVSDIVQHKKTGFLSDDLSSEGLLEGMRFILERNKEFFRESARENAVRKFSADVIRNEYLKVYKNKLNKSK